ncbi:MAG TPA: N-acetylgalactosamine 6-sulfate sulfatase [Verrucomicrobiales bacterium]|nr:N-acetylgalactosamine 6-sulfate sulfatase [Verrucomicrobiales bacterium]
MIRLVLLLSSFCILQSSFSAQPNVVLFLVDDMGWMDCGVYGSKYYETPHMDRFAKRAMRFTQAYANPLCSPSRASIMTGKHPTRHGILTASGHQPPQPPDFKFMPDSAPPNRPMISPISKNYLDPAERTLAEALREAGYHTAHIGKWHLGLTEEYRPEKHGFDVAFHCAPDPGPPGNYFSPYGVTAAGRPTGKSKVGTITDGPPGEYIVDRQAIEAVKFINDNQARPFFLNLWCYGVHGPWGHKPEHTAEFAKKTDPRGMQKNPIMASMLRSVDECFGRILDELDKLGLTDNTLVIFYSDNGGNVHSNITTAGKKSANEDWLKWAGNEPPTNNHPLREGKSSLYEGGTRVPMMWALPGRIIPGTTTGTLAGHIDLYPTVLDLLGLQKQPGQLMDGVSLAPVLTGRGQIGRQAFFNYFPFRPNEGGVTVVSGDFKLIRWFGPGVPRELYNLTDDIGEANNLADKMPEKVRQMDELIDGFLKDTGALVPQSNPAYKPVAAKAAPQNTDPLDGWKERQCKATITDGILTMKSSGRPGSAFLGHGMAKVSGPAVVKLRVRSTAGGAGKIESYPKGSADPSGMIVVPLEVKAGDWQELQLDLSVKGLIGTLRVYLPDAEIDFIEVAPLKGKAQRWDF